MNVKKLVGAAAAGAAASVVLTAPAQAWADQAILEGNVEMVIFGSGYHVSKVTIHGVPEVPGPADYEIIYSATTSPTKTFKMVCGGSSTGNSCSHTFTINATYAHNVGIKSCGTVQRQDTGKNYGVPCKKW
jgi:hypothetical protein